MSIFLFMDKHPFIIGFNKYTAFRGYLISYLTQIFNTLLTYGQAKVKLKRSLFGIYKRLNG